jgi:hypothetical protein
MRIHGIEHPALQPGKISSDADPATTQVVAGLSLLITEAAALVLSGA